MMMVRKLIQSFSPVRVPLSIVALAVVFGVLAYAEVALTRESGRIAALWIPNALLVSAILLSRGDRDGWLLIACFSTNVIANVTVGDRLFDAVGLSICNTLEVTVVCVLMRRWCGATVDLSDMRALARFAFAGGVAGPGVAGLFATMLVSWRVGHFDPGTWLSWSVTDALGLLICTPATMILARHGDSVARVSAKRLFEFLLVLAIGSGVTALVFGQSQYPYLFLVSPFVVVAAFRLGSVGTAVATILIAIVSSIATSLGSGPIQLVHGDLSTKLLVLQLFLATNFGMGLPIAAALEGRERLRAELGQSRDVVQSIIETMNEIIFMTDARGNWTFLNPAWQAILGFSVEQSLGHNAIDFLHPDEMSSGQQSLAALAAAKVSSGRSRRRFLNISGAVRQMEVSFRALYDAEGTYLGTTGNMRDVTERESAEADLKQAQAELIHVSRLSAMGAMASTLAHELNQPLGAVANYVRGLRRLLARDGWDAPPVFAQTLIDIDEGVVRAGEIVRRLRALVERGEVDRKVENVAQLIRESCGIGLVDATLRGVRHRFDFDPATDSIFVDRIQVQQVLVNLLRNAVEAMDQSPTRQIVISTLVQDAFCEIGVHDTGPGVSGAARDRLFVPFNTSKDSGLGIGLSISRTIVEAHGGQIWYEPGILGGGTFRLTLPTADSSDKIRSI